MGRRWLFGLIVVILSSAGQGARAEDGKTFKAQIRTAMEAADEGLIRLSYAKRDQGQSHYHVCYSDERRSPVVNGDTIDQMVLVQIEHRKGRILEINVWTAERWRRDCSEMRDHCVDLGEVDSGPASDWFMALAVKGHRRADSDVAEDALSAAVLARDADIVDPLLEIARDRDYDDDLREDALIWLAIFASEYAAGPLQELTRTERESADFREHAVVALAQLPDDQAYPILMDMGRGHRHPEVQQMALFMLAQYDSDEVVDLLEEILLEN